MPKRPEIGQTVGKVTYIHGGVPRGEVPLQTMAQQQRTTLDQLEAGESDISQHAYEFPPEGLRVRPDAPSIGSYGGKPIYFDDLPDAHVDHYFGISDQRQNGWGDADELDIWAPDQKQAQDQLPPVDFHAIVMAGLLILIMTVLAIGIINLYPTTIFAEFLPRITLPR